MTRITASMVKDLREETNVGMMECKKALQECNGDKEEAVKLLRERGIAIAGKKASREASEGLVDAAVLNDGKKGVMIKVNCETDFVARNDNFKSFVKDLLEKASDVADDELAELEKDNVTAKVAEIGENIKISGNVSFEVEKEGQIASYIHLGGKVGVLLKLAFDNPETKEKQEFKDLARDLTLQIAASNPEYLDRDSVPEEVVSAERDIFAKQMQDKPAHILDQIIDGKMNKYYSQICLLEQEFVKDPDLTVGKLVDSISKKVDDSISIKRYKRYQIGS